jgi:hypothetical protein
MLLRGAHNDVYDMTSIVAADYTSFPNGGVRLGTIVSGITNLGGTPAQCRATTSTAHGLAVGDIAVLSNTASRAYDGQHVITAVNTVANDFDFVFTHAGASTALLVQGFQNARVTINTAGVLLPTNANAAAAMGNAASIYQTSHSGYIGFTHPVITVADATFKIILFGD